MLMVRVLFPLLALLRSQVGPTGVGKTEIARRLAKLVDAPFIKVIDQRDLCDST